MKKYLCSSHTILPAITLVSCLCLAGFASLKADETQDSGEKGGVFSKLFGGKSKDSAKEDATTPSADSKGGGMLPGGTTGRGLPAKDKRVSAAVRGPGGDSGTLVAIAPDPKKPSYTASANPSFFWYQSFSSGSGDLRFNIYDYKSGKSLVGSDKRIPGKHSSGINRVNLGDLTGTTLEPGRTYKWSITEVSSSVKQSANVVAQGRIDRRALPGSLERSVANAETSQRIALLNQGGYFYDAMAAASSDTQRQALIREAGLGAVVFGR